ncbi:S-layer homology domain-containing protein [Alkalihalophilus pseudofirmus]|uniref:S-layer homology domain-containing protein n=1 Tax=Alkalihalophilus pseudofirmus TaxID=79885 RepID=A0AAJ2NPX6_ALKPS|nr:S-layer homology domain-containing protein [Alkalihalophilus pseudofirmus]MDV2886328.1 S-layer homology domain-containing protein [Alkalihalophilus pseudofirmus]
MKKSLIMFLVSLLFMSIFSVSASASERTVDSYIMYDIWGHWAEVELDDLVNADIFKGYTDDNGDAYLAPDQTITRGQFAVLLVRSLNLKPTGSGKSFSDVSKQSGLYNEIQIASDHEIIQGRKDGTFGPNAPITRDQLAAMIVRAFSETIEYTSENKSFTDVSAGYWAMEEIQKASSVGIIRGDSSGKFRPRELAKRAHAGVMLHRALQMESKDLADEAELKQFISSNEKAIYALLSNSDSNGLLELANHYYTGYQKAYFTDLYEWLIFDDIEQTYEFVGEPTIEVSHLSTRFAQLSLNGKLKMTYRDDTTNFETTMDYEEFFYVKKTEDDWKVYYTEMPIELEGLSIK